MFYEEEVINGALCWRGTPNGTWKQFDLMQLTDRIIKLQQEAANSKELELKLESQGVEIQRMNSFCWNQTNAIRFVY